MDRLPTKNLPFTLHLGDFNDRDFTAFGAVLPLLERLGHPVCQVLGNHDYTVAEGEKCRVVSTLGMAHEPEVNAFSAIHLFADRLEIEGNGREKSRVIPLARL